MAASYRLVGHCIDLQTSTLISSFGCSSVGSHPVSVALAAGHHHFVGFPPGWHAFGGSASTAHASPSDDFLFSAYNASCGVPRIAFFGWELGVGG